MKKKFLVLIIVLAAVIVLSGCVQPADTETAGQKEAKSLANATAEGKAITGMQVELEKLKNCTATELAGPMDDYFATIEAQTGIAITESEKEQAIAQMSLSLEALKLCLPKLVTSAKSTGGSKYEVSYKYETPKLCEQGMGLTMPGSKESAFIVKVDVASDSTTIADDDKMNANEVLAFEQFMALSEAAGDCGFLVGSLQLAATMGGGEGSGDEGTEGAGDAGTGETADDSA